MKPSELATFLQSAMRNRIPVLIVGGPGVGKTSIVAQAAEAIGNDLIVSHPAVDDPTDGKGLPWPGKDGKDAQFIPIGQTARVLRSKQNTTWFLDDLGQAQPAVQASYMPWLLARECAGHTLPDCVTMIAATNRRTDRAGVSGVLEPVKSRFGAIVELEPDLDEWCEWALSKDWFPPVVVAFLRFKAGEGLNGKASKSGLLYQFEASADLVNSPVPRTWENAARLLTLNLPAEVEAQAVAGAIGQGAAAELLAFVRMFRQLPNIDAILMDPDKADVPTSPSVLYAVTTALASRTTDQNFGRIGKYAAKLAAANKGEFATLLVRDATRRCPDVQTTPAFVKLMAGELGQLIGGTVR